MQRYGKKLKYQKKTYYFSFLISHFLFFLYLCIMTVTERIYFEGGKFIANLIAGVIPCKATRHKVRQALNPLNPERCVRYVYRHYVAGTTVSDNGSIGLPSSYIWQCWLQGEQQAPPVVKQCLESVRKYLRPDQRQVIITADNYAAYVSLPDYIIEKWQSGIITNTHFSDILRVNLLAKYGGYWIDATCLLLEPMPEWTSQKPNFLFHSHGEFSYTLIQSCFLYSRPSTYLMCRWRDVLHSYWKEENTIIQYFLLHLIFRALVDGDPKFREEYQLIDRHSDEPMHILLNIMRQGQPISESEMKQAADALFVQKLTYKTK